VPSLRVDLTWGRLRLARHLAAAAVSAVGAWAWFGWSGLVPLAIWAWHVSPRPGARERLELDSVRSIRLGRLLTRVTVRGGATHDVFSDELPAACLAAFRRELKGLMSAGDGAQNVEPV
jgi:hypothetical protein